MRIPPSTTPYARYTAPKPAAAAESAKAIETARDLRQVLTSEEESFFAETAPQGALWYGRDGAASTAPKAELGQRVDIRG